MKFQYIPVLCLALLLIGCASQPAEPYWQDPNWVNELGKTIQKNIQYPEVLPQNASTNGVLPSGKAVVQLTYEKGALNSVEIIKSTGFKVLDDSLLNQIPHIKPPLAQGPNAGESHQFQIPISIGPFNIALFRYIRNELQNHIVYPRSAILHGDQGLVVVGFRYKSGRIFDPHIIKSSGYPELDRSVLNELLHVKLINPPQWFSGNTFDLTTSYCFTFHNQTCSGQIQEVRYEAVKQTSEPPATEACALVEFNYIDGKAVNVELLHSSGYPALDKKGLMLVTQGKFNIPATKMDNPAKKYQIPVCEKFQPGL
ncbi:MAG: energy transducer TonB [Gammaproteobacteria bacterium]|nr:energy transducer TonB [Gammaproteobacteria bacterium]MDE2344980.1 energy transducer TonB [Gammaproteobacteria bacterium]